MSSVYGDIPVGIDPHLSSIPREANVLSRNADGEAMTVVADPIDPGQAAAEARRRGGVGGAWRREDGISEDAIVDDVSPQDVRREEFEWGRSQGRIERQGALFEGRRQPVGDGGRDDSHL